MFGASMILAGIGCSEYPGIHCSVNILLLTRGVPSSSTGRLSAQLRHGKAKRDSLAIANPPHGRRGIMPIDNRRVC